MTRKVGYARVSTDGQNLGRQLAALHQEGCDPIFQDKASGKSVRGRPGLDKAIKALRPGDVLVLAESAGSRSRCRAARRHAEANAWDEHGPQFGRVVVHLG